MELAYCGLDCAACPAFHAAERLTSDERQAVADKWNVDFGGSHTAGDIDCVGCTHEGRHTPYCEDGCEIRKCGVGEGCGYVRRVRGLRLPQAHRIPGGRPRREG